MELSQSKDVFWNPPTTLVNQVTKVRQPKIGFFTLHGNIWQPSRFSQTPPAPVAPRLIPTLHRLRHEAIPFGGFRTDRGTPIQWSFVVPLIGGRWYIIPQLAVYTTCIFPIGWLYITYHLLREPETAIDLYLYPIPFLLIGKNDRIQFVHGLWDKHFIPLNPNDLPSCMVYIYIYIHEHGLFLKMCREVYLNLTWMIWAWNKSRFSLQRFRTTKQRFFTFNFTAKEYIIYKKLEG